MARSCAGGLCVEFRGLCLPRGFYNLGPPRVYSSRAPAASQAYLSLALGEGRRPGLALVDCTLRSAVCAARSVAMSI